MLVYWISCINILFRNCPCNFFYLLTVGLFNILGLDMNGTHQVLAYADDVKLIGDDIRTIETNADICY